MGERRPPAIRRLSRSSSRARSTRSSRSCTEAGGTAEDIGRLTVYVTNLAAYRENLKPLGEAWRARFGRHFPAMALVEVTGFVDRGAMVEIEATAVVRDA